MKQHLTYQTRGTCSRAIEVELEDGVIVRVRFVGGCPGNTLGISKLVIGMRADEVIARLKGNRCGGKPTSCPDQLTLALEECLAGNTSETEPTKERERI